MSSFQFEAIGTHWQIDFRNCSKLTDAEIQSKILTKIEEFDLNYSRFRKDSWVTRVAYKKTESQVPKNFDEIYSLYVELNKISDGLFTPLIGSTLEQAGYDKEYTLKAGQLTSPPLLPEAISYNKPEIRFNEEVLLDFGAGGKGYLADIIGDFLETKEISDFCIDASGDILNRTQENAPIRIGLEHPDDPTIAIGVCELKNGSICASAGNRRKWGNFHHTINPFTLISPTQIKATWVVAESALIADSLATCFFLDPDPDKYNSLTFEYVIMYEEDRVLRSHNFPGELFT